MYQTTSGKDANGRRIPWAQILGNPHRITVTVQIEDGNGALLSYGLGLVSGDVTIDRSAQHRRSCRLELAPYGGSGIVNSESGLTADQIQALKDSLLPAKAGDPVTPYGNQLRVWYGVEVTGGNPYYYAPSIFDTQLGVFKIASVDVTDDETPRLSLTAFDLSRPISRNKLTQPYLVQPGTNWGDAIIALCKDRYPQLRWSAAHSVSQSTSTLVVVDPQQDPWAVATQWATAVGQEVYFDNTGTLVIRPEPDPATSPVSWVYADAGSDRNATILSVGKSLSDEPGYNGVVLTSESATLPTPLRSEAWDLNPSSPTYSLGPYGKVPKFVSSPYVATQAQADTAAQVELTRSIGGTEQIQLAAIPNPAHEAGDVVRVVRPLSKIDSVALVESITIPLAADGAMSLSCRERRSLS